MILPCILLVQQRDDTLKFLIFLTKYEELDLATIISELGVIYSKTQRVDCESVRRSKLVYSIQVNVIKTN